MHKLHSENRNVVALLVSSEQNAMLIRIPVIFDKPERILTLLTLAAGRLACEKRSQEPNPLLSILSGSQYEESSAI